LKQGIALTGRNTTGPPLRAAAAAPGELRCICAEVTDDDGSPEIKKILAPTLCVDGPEIMHALTYYTMVLIKNQVSISSSGYRTSVNEQIVGLRRASSKLLS